MDSRHSRACAWLVKRAGFWPGHTCVIACPPGATENVSSALRWVV